MSCFCFHFSNAEIYNVKRYKILSVLFALLYLFERYAYLYLFTFPVVTLKLLTHIFKWFFLMCRINKYLSLWQAKDFSLLLHLSDFPTSTTKFRSLFSTYSYSVYSPSTHSDVLAVQDESRWVQRWTAENKLLCKLSQKKKLKQNKEDLISHHLTYSRHFSQCASPVRQNQ